MRLKIEKDGTVKAIYSEAISLASLGAVSITRASHVEYANSIHGGGWMADLSPVDGPTLGPFATRSESLAAEVEWLQANGF